MEPHRIRDQRMHRAQVKERLKGGSTSLSHVLQEAQADEVISGMRVSTLLESLPGTGKARARQIMNELGIAESGLVRELSAGQRTALAKEHGRLTVPQGSTPAQDHEQGHRGDVVDDGESGRNVAADHYYGENLQSEPTLAPENDEGYGVEDWDRL